MWSVMQVWNRELYIHGDFIVALSIRHIDGNNIMDGGRLESFSFGLSFWWYYAELSETLSANIKERGGVMLY